MVPWITSDLRKGMRDGDVAKRKTIKSNDPQNWAVYKRLHNKINGEVKLPRHPITLLHLFSLSYADYIVSSNNKLFSVQLVVAMFFLS